MEKNFFDDKLKHLNEEVTLTNNDTQISEKGHDFLLCRMYFTGLNDYQKFLVFYSMIC